MENLIEYEDPILYDLENREFEPDGDFILEMIRVTGEPVLELGCGTGRITIPLAQRGINITGIDIVPGMLERARQKAKGVQIEWVLEDVRCFHLPENYRLIFETGSVFQHMLTRKDQEEYLGRVKEHLAADGFFVFAIFFPHPNSLEDVPEEQPWFSYTDEHGRIVNVSGTEYYDELRQVKLETAYRRWTEPGGKEILRVAPLSLRYIFPEEIKGLLYYNGFDVVEQFGGWEREPLTNESRLIVTICKARQP